MKSIRCTFHLGGSWHSSENVVRFWTPSPKVQKAPSLNAMPQRQHTLRGSVLAMFAPYYRRGAHAHGTVLNRVAVGPCLGQPHCAIFAVGTQADASGGYRAVLQPKRLPALP